MESEPRPAWMEDELVRSIDPKKLDFLNRLFREGHGLGQKEMMTYLIPMMKKARQEHLSFSPQEMNAAVTAIRRHSTKEEQKQIDKILARGRMGR